jgi:hypothetical protein
VDEHYNDHLKPRKRSILDIRTSVKSGTTGVDCASTGNNLPASSTTTTTTTTCDNTTPSPSFPTACSSSSLPGTPMMPEPTSALDIGANDQHMKLKKKLDELEHVFSSDDSNGQITPFGTLS